MHAGRGVSWAYGGGAWSLRAATGEPIPIELRIDASRLVVTRAVTYRAFDREALRTRTWGTTLRRLGGRELESLRREIAEAPKEPSAASVLSR